MDNRRQQKGADFTSGCDMKFLFHSQSQTGAPFRFLPKMEIHPAPYIMEFHPTPYIWNSLHYYHQMGSINRSHCCHIFRGCVPDVAVPSYAGSFMYIPGKPGFLSSVLLCSLMMCANNRSHYDLMVVYLSAHHTTSFWTSKMLARKILCV